MGFEFIPLPPHGCVPTPPTMNDVLQLHHHFAGVVDVVNATAFRWAGVIALPPNVIPQSLASVAVTVVVVLVLAIVCFPSAAKALLQMLVFSPWLIASLIVTVYNFALVIWTLGRIFISLLLFLLVKLVRGVWRRIFRSAASLYGYACAGSVTALVQTVRLRQQVRDAATFEAWLPLAAAIDALDGTHDQQLQDACPGHSVRAGCARGGCPRDVVVSLGAVFSFGVGGCGCVGVCACSMIGGCCAAPFSSWSRRALNWLLPSMNGPTYPGWPRWSMPVAALATACLLRMPRSRPPTAKTPRARRQVLVWPNGPPLSCNVCCAARQMTPCWQIGPWANYRAGACRSHPPTQRLPRQPPLPPRPQIRL